MHKPQLFFLFGAWLSFVGIILAGVSFVPLSKNVHTLSPAAIYRAVEQEELRARDTLPGKGRVIAIDETGMKLSLYEDGLSVHTYGIRALATPFSLYEVPVGSYAVSKKEPQHLSLTTGKWMSSVVQFGDNFFIHAPAYVLGGEKVSSENGVSIELSELDAKEVYEFALVGIKVVVTGGYPRSTFSSTSQYYLQGEGKLPPVTAPAFYVADIDTGEVLWARNPNDERQAGRLISFTTALTAIENLDQYKTISVGDLLLDSKVTGRHLPSNDDKLPLGSLMYPLLFDANETAEQVLLRSLGNKSFADYMNKQVMQLGMNQTSIASASMLDQSTTTPHDLFQLLQHINTQEHFLLDVSLSRDHAIFSPNGIVRYRWENKNPWVINGSTDYRGGLGTRSPSGGGSGMFIFGIPFAEFGERQIAIIIIDSSDLEGDVHHMKEFTRTHYHFGIRRDLKNSEALEDKNWIEKIKGFFREDIIYDRNI